MEEKKRVKESLKYSIKEGVAASAMSGFGNSYVSPFAIAMNASNTIIGLLTSIPNLLAPLFQLNSLKVLENIKTRKVVVSRAVFLNAVMWLPILLIPFLFSNYKGIILLVFYTILVIFMNYGGPAWASWMGDLVSAERRGEYFGKRNIICDITAVVSTLIAGIVLNSFTKVNKVFLGFALIFIFATISRFISWYLLKKQYEPRFMVDKKYYFSIWQFIRRIKHSNFGKFVVYIALINFSANVAGPFFAVYMLRNLSFSYLTYSIVGVAASVASFFGMSYWGKYADKYGNLDVIKNLAFFISILPILWLMSTNIYFILLIQIIAGFTWAGFNLSAFNFVNDATSQEKRAICFSYFNIFNGVGVFFGALLGGLLSTRVSLPIFMYSLYFVFLLSGVLRILSSFILLPRIKEVRKVESGKPRWDTIGIGPMYGLLKSVIVGIYVGSSRVRKIRWKKWRNNKN